LAARLCLDPLGETYSALTDPLAGLKGRALGKGKGGKKEGRKWEGKREREKGRENRRGLTSVVSQTRKMEVRGWKSSIFQYSKQMKKHRPACEAHKR